MSIKVGAVTAAVAAVASMMAILVVSLVLEGPGGGPPTGWEPPSASDWLKWLWQAVPPALCSGLLGYFLAGQLLHRSRRRGYVAGATLPLIALAIYMLGLVGPQSVTQCLRSGSGGARPCVGDVAFEVAVYLGYAIMIVGWLIVPAGIVSTALIRRRWLDAAG